MQSFDLKSSVNELIKSIDDFTTSIDDSRANVCGPYLCEDCEFYSACKVKGEMQVVANHLTTYLVDSHK